MAPEDHPPTSATLLRHQPHDIPLPAHGLRDPSSPSLPPSSPPALTKKALVQLPSVSVAKATMRHYEEDEEPKIGSKRVYLNYSRSRSIEARDGESLAVNMGNFNSNNSGSSNGGGGGGGNSNGGTSGLDLARAINAARGLDGNGGGNPLKVSERALVLCFGFVFFGALAAIRPTLGLPVLLFFFSVCSYIRYIRVHRLPAVHGRREAH